MLVPATEAPPCRLASVAAGIVHKRPAPTAVALLVSSPIQRLLAASSMSRLVLLATNAKLDTSEPVRSAPPCATNVYRPVDIERRHTWLLPRINGLPAMVK